jgi:hypothetical protein
MLKPRIWKAATVAMIAVTMLSACGKKTFKKLEESSKGIAGQYLYIKPKLDLVIFQDNSDSMANAMAQLKPQLSNFLSQLDTNWEYRVIVMPLLSTQNISSKVALATDCAGVPAGGCVTASGVSYFNSLSGDSGWINSRNSSTGNVDLGFQNMNYNINHLISSGFLRSDASLAMMIISNNDDHSGVSYITRPDGATTSIDYNSATTINSFNAYKSYFQSVKASTHLERLYSVVAAQSYSDCYGGGRTWAGIRYMNMAAALGGVSYDLCNNGLSSVLYDIRSRLVTVVQTIEFNYVVFPEEPTPSSITYKKNGTTIPQSNVNGWEYVGMRSGPTSFSPVLGNNRSGYMLKLNGSATLKGTDTYELIYTRK